MSDFGVNRALPVLLLLVAAGCSLADDEARIPGEGLAAYYSFDGNAEDESENGHNGIIHGATLAEDRFGRIRRAYEFDGVDDYIDLGSSSSLKPPLPVTVAAWIRIDELTGFAMFTNNYDQNVNNGVWISTSGIGEFAIGFGNGGPIGDGSRRTKRGETILEPGQWYHVAGVVRGPDDMNIYINGIEDGGYIDGLADTLTYSTGPGNIGRRGQGHVTTVPPKYFKGAIDDLVFYRRALTEEEIYSLYTLR